MASENLILKTYRNNTNSLSSKKEKMLDLLYLYKESFISMKSTIILIVSSAVLVFFTSCSINRNVYVDMQHSLVDKSVQLNLIGIDNYELNQAVGAGYNNFWRIDGIENIYGTSKYVVNFPAFSNETKKTLPSDNIIWSKWYHRNCNYLLVAVNLPYSNSKNIKWKDIILMESYSWYNFWSDRNLYISINENGILVRNGIQINNKH
ncbi:MAG: hypothetical protein GY756_00825 [bacterium]|nr:hypothetical protein [bacterium]